MSPVNSMFVCIIIIKKDYRQICFKLLLREIIIIIIIVFIV